MDKLTRLLANDRIRRLVPRPIKAALRRHLPYADYRNSQLRQAAEKRFDGPIPLRSSYPSPYPLTLGVFSDKGYTFAHNVAACRELQVAYQVIDITANDWVEQVQSAKCDAFLATPTALLNLWHQVQQERLWFLTQHLQKLLCPTFDELYLWESKRRMRDWLVVHQIPHPETWLFFERTQALRFCRETSYPLVCKSNSGAASSGVFILDNRRSAEALVRQAFSKGILARAADAREREWGTILFQAYVPHDFEWRVVRIGDDFMCRRKVRIGAHASGSGDIGWAKPLPGMLDFVRALTDRGGFTSMAVDLFENSTGRGESPFLVNELQALFGEIKRAQQHSDDAGRWRHDPRAQQWRFEKGDFYRNACANLRVQLLLQQLGAASPSLRE